jgi:Predicted membrane protein (DUF2232)
MRSAGQLTMMQSGLIGIGAGAAAAFLFVSPASGTPLALLLLLVAPLPILIAAIGWSHRAGLVAVGTAALGLTAVFGVDEFQSVSIPFVLGIGAPAWWLGYLALLARHDPATGSVEWYPAGSLVFWSAILGAAVMLVVIPFYGMDLQTFHATLRKVLETALRLDGGPASGSALRSADQDRFIDFLVAVMPPAAAALGSVTNMLNLWLAGRILHISGRLRRPWPDLPAMRLPPIAPVLLIATLIGSYLSGMAGLIMGIFSAALLIAHTVGGLAIVHTLTRGVPGRVAILSAIYGALPFFAALRVLHWPVFALTGLALIDCLFDLRGRLAQRRPPALRE